MLGSICGDIIGSIYERNNIKTKEFKLFTSKNIMTDDSIMTIATMEALLLKDKYQDAYRKWYRKYPDLGYGKAFRNWAQSENQGPYNSWGNGSAMRVSPIAYYYDSIEEVKKASKESAEVSHNHIEGIKGAQAVACAMYLARKSKRKKEIKSYIEETFYYDLNETIDSIRKWYKFDVSCQGSIPQAIIAFLEGETFEDTIRNAISIGGDSDTIASIAGAIAEAYYGEVPKYMLEETLKYIKEEELNIIKEFYKRIGKSI